MNKSKSRRENSFNKALKNVVDIVTDTVSPVVGLFNPVLAIPAGIISSILKNILTDIIDSEDRNHDFEPFVMECCKLANIDSSEQKQYVSVSLQICKDKQFEKISTSCLGDLEVFYNDLISLTTKYENIVPKKGTNKLVDLLFYCCSILEIQRLSPSERNKFFSTEIIKLILASKAQNKIQSIELISTETRRPKDSFNSLSRINEINRLISEINKNEKIGLVSGIGGIGKTEICKHIFHKCRTQNPMPGIKYIGWITYNNSLAETLYSQIKCDKNESSVYAGYEDSLAYLNSLGNELLLFVDNLDNTMTNDSEIIKLLNLNCKLVITTRIQNIDGIKPIVIGALDEHWTREVFTCFCEREYSEADLHKIYDITQGHPLTVELLAKTINHLSDPISDIICRIEAGGFNLKEIDKSIPFEEYNNCLIGHLKRFFSVQKLPSKYKQILYRFSLLPNYGVSSEQLNSYKIGDTNDIEYLINRGWIESSDERIAMHPVISEAILSVSSNTYAHYIKMYIAIKDLLEIPPDVFPETKYSDALISNYILGRKHFNKTEYAQALGNLGVIYNKMDNKDYAIRLHKESARIKESIDSSDPTLFTTYNNIGIAYNQMNDPKSNIYYLEKAKSIGLLLYTQSPEKYARDYATTLNNLSLAYLNYVDSNIPTIERLNLAKDYQNECINIIKSYYGDKYILLARSYNNIAHVYRALGDYDEEVSYRKKALAIPNSPERPIHLFNFANMEFNKGNTSDAIPAIREAISSWENMPEFHCQKLIKAYPLYIKMLDNFPAEQLQAQLRLKELVEKCTSK